MGEFLLAINVVVVVCLIVAVFAFWKAAEAAEETRKIAAELSALIYGSEKTERENNG